MFVFQQTNNDFHLYYHHHSGNNGSGKRYASVLKYVSAANNSLLEKKSN